MLAGLSPKDRQHHQNQNSNKTITTILQVDCTFKCLCFLTVRFRNLMQFIHLEDEVWFICREQENNECSSKRHSKVTVNATSTANNNNNNNIIMIANGN